MKKGLCICAGIMCLRYLVLSISPCAQAAGAGVADTPKSCNLSLLYGLIAFLSLVLVVAYYWADKNREKKFVLLFACVFIANSGYFMLSIAANLKWALIANRISYFGAAYSVLLMLLIIMDVCNIEYSKRTMAILAAVSTLVFLVAASGGVTSHYYSRVTIAEINGMTTLVKEYGPLHALYPLYLILYFALMVWVIVKYAVRGKSAAPQYALFLAAVVLGNIAVWLVEQLIQTDFEFLSVSYIATELLLLLLYSTLRSYGILTIKGQVLAADEPTQNGDVSAAVPQPEVAELLDAFAQNVSDLSAAEARILNYYIDGHEIAEIPGLAYISINTVKKHNRSIYHKLGVSSRDDLMLYIDIFRRCGRLEELRYRD